MNFKITVDARRNLSTNKLTKDICILQKGH